MAHLTVEMCDMLNAEEIDALHRNNIWTVNELFTMDLMEIKRLTKIKYHLLKRLKDKVEEKYTLSIQNFEFLVDKCLSECKMCPTGIPELTMAMDGGFQTQEIVEFFGETETGKTELCYLLCGQILSHYNDFQVVFVTSNQDFDHEKVVKYIKLKAGNKLINDEEIFNSLKKIQIARPTKFPDVVHLLNTLVHNDPRNHIRCIIIDSLSFIIQDDILDIKTSDLSDGDELEKFAALGATTIFKHDPSMTIESMRKYLVDVYLNEIMKLLTHIALIKNLIIILTNCDSHLAFSKSWTNSVDHRIHLTKIEDFDKSNPSYQNSTVLKATISKTLHNISRIGYSIPFTISDEGLFAIRKTHDSSD